jgi:hypothetical protein
MQRLRWWYKRRRAADSNPSTYTSTDTSTYTSTDTSTYTSADTHYKYNDGGAPNDDGTGR